MNKSARDRAVAKLRSGGHRQSFDAGRSDDGAVSADVIVMEALGHSYPTSPFEDPPPLCPEMTRLEWQNFLGDVITLNQEGKTVDEIADHIKRTY